MIKYFIVLILLLSNGVFAEEPIKLMLENHNNNLKLSLKNESYGRVLVNKRFSLGTTIELAEVDLIVVNKEGIEFPLCAMVTVGRLTERDVIALDPGEYIGVDYLHNNIISMYCLKAGQYRVKAKYKNRSWLDKGLFNGSLESNWVTIEVNENKE